MVKNIYFISICIIVSLCITSCHTKEETKATNHNSVCGEIVQMDSIYQNKKSNKEALAFWDEQLYLTQNASCENRIQFYRCLTFINENKVDSSRTIARQLLRVYENTTQYRQLAEIYSVLGEIHSMDNKFVLSTYYYNTSAEIILNFNLTRITPNILQTLARASDNSRNQKQFKKSIAYLEKGKEILRDLQNKSVKDYYSYLFAILRLTAELERPEPNFTLCKRMLANLKYDSSQFSKDSVEKLYNYYVAKSDYHHKVKEPDSCIQSQLMAIRYSENFDAQVDIKANLVGLYCETDALKKAGLLIAELIDTIGHFNESTRSNFNENYVEYLIRTGQTEKAYKAYQNHMQKKDKLYASEYANASAELSSIYELKNKELRIKRLYTKVSRKDVVIRRNELILVVTVGLLLIAIISFLWYRNLQRGKQLHLQNEKMLADNQGLNLKQRLLRSQMDPHFIFNSLSALQSFIRNEKNELSLTYLGLFSKLLRGNLESSVAKEINLAEEINLIENYLQLQQLRYDNRFEYNIVLSEAVNDEKAVLRMPPMLIQPFIENAVIHGVRNLEYPGKISLEINKVNESLHITITDNGKGFSKNKTDDKKHTSYAISLARERLRLIEDMTGQQTNLTIYKNGGEKFGVKVDLQLPISFL